MIMQGTTPRALTWSGLLAVLSFSATLLPLSFTWAQQRPPLEEDFFITLKKDLEFNDPRWPFLIKVKDVQDKTLIGATFKHRAGSEHPNSFDMVVQAEKATIEFDKEKGVARVHFDGAEITNPREDVSLADNQTLEIPIPGDRNVADGEDEEASVSAAEEPAARDRGPRPKRGGDRRDAPKTKDKRDVRTFRYNGEELKERSEALEKALAELREVASRKEGGSTMSGRVQSSNGPLNGCRPWSREGPPRPSRVRAGDGVLRNVPNLRRDGPTPASIRNPRRRRIAPRPRSGGPRSQS